MVDNFNKLDTVNGIQAIPFMQVILMLTTVLDGSQETDQNVLQKLLAAIIERLEMSEKTPVLPMVSCCLSYRLRQLSFYLKKSENLIRVWD